MKKCEWYIYLYPGGYHDRKYMSVYLISINSNPIGQEIGYKFQLIGFNDSIKSDSYSFAGKNNIHGFATYFRNDAIGLNCGDRDGSLPHDTLTLRCRLWYANTENVESAHCVARTRMGVERICFVWNLKEFSNLQQDLKKTYTIPPTSRIESPLKSLSIFWDCKTYPNDEMTAQIELKTYRYTVLTCKLSVIGAKGKPIQLVKNGYSFDCDEQERILTLPPLFSRMQLMAKKDIYVNNDVLSLMCEFAVSTTIESHKIEETYIGPKSHHSLGKDIHIVNCPHFDNVLVASVGGLKCDLESLYTEGINCDVNLRIESEKSEGGGFIFTWVIENFSFCNKKFKELLNSPNFIADNMKKSEWCIRLFPGGHDDRKYMSVYLKSINGNPSGEAISYEFQLIGFNDSLKSSSSSFVENNKLHGFRNYFGRDAIGMNYGDRDGSLPHDTLTLRCRLWYANTEIVESAHCVARTRMGVERICFVWNLKEFSNLQQDLKKTYTIPPTSRIESPLKSLSIFWDCKTYPNDEVTAKIELKTYRYTVLTCKLSVIGAKGKPIQLVKNGYSFDGDEQERILTLPPLFSRMQLMARKDTYINNDVLSLICQFAVSTTIESHKIEETYIGPKSHHSLGKDIHIENCPHFDNVLVESVGGLKCDLESLYTESINCDVNLRIESEATTVGFFA
ncbi:speckle-type POZ protein [Caerostris darwini]|uniref:Speckle-type POZ protein n=1 Tax=Caerostris darwini TaxID=1538125 RepID=A0AAV4R794_9ARAC|nr:speckle-type POZ protein [Caerostris darwini]